jgi:hypothetical protein
MLRNNQSQSTQHSYVISIDETNIFFILLTIILLVLDWRQQELNVSYFSAYLLFFLAVASKQCALTVCIHQYFNRHCPRVLVMFRHDFGRGGRGALSHRHCAHIGTTVGKIVHCC